MRKAIIVLAFLGLMEYQVFFHESFTAGAEFHNLEYSPVVAVGLLLLSVYELLRGARGFERKQKLKEKIQKRHMVMAALYILAIIVGGAWAQSFGRQFLVLLGITVIGLVSASIAEIFIQRKQKGKKGKKTDIESTRISAFTIPILYLYVINFLLAAQLGNNLSLQFILVLSGLILFDNLRHEEQFVQKFKKTKVNSQEVKHYIFHRWSKYFDFFLGLWYFLGLYLNGVISVHAMLALLFLYMVIFFTVLLRITHYFNVRDFLGIFAFAGVLTSIPAVIYLSSDWRPEAYLIAIFIFLAFDLGDIYWHHRLFSNSHKAPAMFWLQKAAIYMLIFAFIWQLHEITANPHMTVDNVYTSVFGSGEVVNETAPRIDVPDAENAIHIRGE